MPPPAKKTKAAQVQVQPQPQPVVIDNEAESEALDAATETGAKRKKMKNGCRAEKVYEHPLRTRLYRVYPTPEQRSTFRRWLAAHRKIYNMGVKHMRAHPKCTLKELRAACRMKKADREGQATPADPKLAWLYEVPFDIRDDALHDLIKARGSMGAKNAARNKRGEDPVTYTLQFRTRRDRQQTLALRKRWWNRPEKSRSQFAALLGPRVLKTRAGSPLPEMLEADIKLRYDRLGRYFLCIPEQVAPVHESLAPASHHGVIALDPGVRTFQTMYDADGQCIEWGAGDMNGIFRLCYAADKLQSKIAEPDISYQQRRRRRKAFYRVYERIHNRVKETHCKLAAWLCRNYRVILLPKFETQQMIRRGERKLRCKTVRQMCTWSHYSFRQRLLDKAALHPWCKVVICDEAYTSKTCGQCGAIHQKLGGNKTFRCPTCAYEADRDVSAARNILLRYLTLQKISL